MSSFPLLIHGSRSSHHSVGFLSAMLLSAVFYQPEKLAAMFRGDFRYPGLSSYGGFIGGIGAAIWFRQRRRMSILVLGDVRCFAFPFAWLFGRLGCFLVHDHVGTVTDFFLAVDDYNRQGQPRHALGLYEVFWSAFAIGPFLWLARKPRKLGFLLALLPLGYAPVRLFLDILREVPAFGGDVRYRALTPAQYASIAFTAIGIAVAVRVTRGPAQLLSSIQSPCSRSPRGSRTPCCTSARSCRSRRRRCTAGRACLPSTAC